MKQPRTIYFWEELYRDEDVKEMPWYTSSLDHDIERALKDYSLKNCSVLDLGSGPGTQAVELAKRGFRVTGSDVSKSAVAKAAEYAKAEGVKVKFLTDNILDSLLEGPFDLIIDRGCFHVLPPDKRLVYVQRVYDLLIDTGLLFLKCFSHLQPGEDGPYRLSPPELTECFLPPFKEIDIKESKFSGTFEEQPVALFSVISKSA